MSVRRILAVTNGAREAAPSSKGPHGTLPGERNGCGPPARMSPAWSGVSAGSAWRGSLRTHRGSSSAQALFREVSLPGFSMCDVDGPTSIPDSLYRLAL